MSFRLRSRGTATAAGVAAVALLGASATVLAQPTTMTTAHASANDGQSTQGRVSSIVGLGDSVPAGTNCDCADFISRAGQKIADRQSSDVDTLNASVPGQTSAELLDELDDPTMTAAIRAADVVIIEIGANDFDPELVSDDEQISPEAVFGNELDQLGVNLVDIVDRVQALHGGEIQVILVGYWNDFAAGPEATARGPEYTPNAMAVTDASNAVTQKAAAESGAKYIDLVSAFAAYGDIESLLEDDGEHPNATGHEVIADAVAAAIA